MSIGVGACASAVPLAAKKPKGGLDSRNRRDALRMRPELAVEERLRVTTSSAPSVGDAGTRLLVVVEDISPASDAIANSRREEALELKNGMLASRSSQRVFLK